MPSDRSGSLAARITGSRGVGRSCGPRLALALAVAVLLPATASGALASELGRAAVSDAPAEGVTRTPLPPHQADGLTITRVFLDLSGGTGDADRDRSVRIALDRLTDSLKGSPFSTLLAERVLSESASIADLRDIAYAVYPGSATGDVVLVLTATLSAQAARADKVTGALESGQWQDLPTLLQDERRLLRVQLNGGFGAYADHNPWFGSPATYTGRSPIASDPPGAGTTAWNEAWVEYGLAGGTRLGESRTYAYGEVTALTSGSAGHDLFRSDTRSTTFFEKAYAGALWDLPGSGHSARITVGRQNWQIDEGFLFSRFAAGANAGPYAGLYMNPRTTFERAVIAEWKAGPMRAEYFDVDPSELAGYDSGTRFRGIHLSWVEKAGWDLGMTGYRVVESGTRFQSPTGGTIDRKGQQTWSVRVGHKRVAGVEGLAALGEYAHQGHRDQDVSARAWYAQLGYTWRSLPWRPSLTYRYASFSGDDPSTPTREAFDAPLSSGLDHWVQGVSFKKAVTNSNLDSHRIRLHLEPTERLSYTLDWFRLSANVPMATGESAYGDEIDIGVRWAISKRLYFLGVAGIAFPGAAIKAQTQGAARPWTTVQASLFWGF